MKFRNRSFSRSLCYLVEGRKWAVGVLEVFCLCDGQKAGKDGTSGVKCSIIPASLMYKTESQLGAFSRGFISITVILETLSKKHCLTRGWYLAIGRVVIYI